MLCRGVVVLGNALVAVRAHLRKFACAGRSTRDRTGFGPLWCYTGAAKSKMINAQQPIIEFFVCEPTKFPISIYRPLTEGADL